MAISRIFVLGLFFSISPTLSWAEPMAPVTKEVPVTDKLHGKELVDPFRWLEDQQGAPTREWIAAQNKYTQSLLENLPTRNTLRKKLEELMKTNSIGIPVHRNGKYFFQKRSATQDLAVLCVRDLKTGEDRVLVDPMTLKSDGSVSVDLMDVCEDGEVIAYALREGGKDEVEIRFMQTETGKDLSDRLPAGRYFGISIRPSKKSVFYCLHGKEGSRIKEHVFGNEPASAKELFGEGYGPGVIVAPSLSEDGKYLLATVIYGSAADKTDVYIKDLANDSPFQPIVNDVKARFQIDLVDDELFIQTNWNAPNGRVLKTTLDKLEKSNWKEIIPEGKGVIAGTSAVAGKIVVQYLEDVHSEMDVFDTAGKKLTRLKLPTLGSASGPSGQWKNDEIFFSFVSFAYPPAVMKANLKTEELSVWEQTNVPLDPSMFESKQIRYTSKDGTQIPMFVVGKKGALADKARPCYLTGYGGFNISLTPTFSPPHIAFIEQGGVVAVPNLRGGGEFGENWHQAGMRDRKQNVFDDFIAAGEWLCKEGYTSKDKLAIAGRSNGGLLVGAALTQRPDLFRAVVCGYPLLDMIRYQQFLVARFWVPEYGSSEDPKQFDYLLAYSPYHQVKAGVRYPAILFITGDADTRVDPLHARKMAALMQKHATPDRPVLLHYDTKAGHSAGRPVSTRIDDSVDELSFLLWQLGQ